MRSLGLSACIALVCMLAYPRVAAAQAVPSPVATTLATPVATASASPAATASPTSAPATSAPSVPGSSPAPTGVAPAAPAPAAGASEVPSASASPSPSSSPARDPRANTIAQPDALLNAGQYLLKAKSIRYYSSRSIVTADDNVMLLLPGGVRVTGQTFAMDLKLNRLLVAGDVTLQYGTTTLHGAGFARFFTFDRSYMIPVTTEPDRWTFLGNDFEHPLKGREMPGDTFFLPDLSHSHPFIIAREALFVPNQGMRFTPASIVLGGVPVPSPVYFLNLSPNSYYAQNSLAGASFDGPYPIAGGTHTRSTAHLRYDPINHFYGSLEQQLAVTDHSYISTSANPLTRPQRQYNLIAFDHLAPKIDGRLFLQESAFQQWFNQPLSAGALAAAQLTFALPHSYVQLNQDFFYNSLLARPFPVDGLYYYGDPSHPWSPEHPSDGAAVWVGIDQSFLPHDIYLKSLLKYRLRSGIGYAHNNPPAEGFQPILPPELGGVIYTTIYNNFVGATITTASVKVLKDAKGRGRDVLLNAFADLQHQTYSEPHHVDTVQETASLSKAFDAKTQAFVSYSIANIRDNYGNQQSAGYPPNFDLVSPVNNQVYPGYGDFRGFATTHTLAESVIYTASPYFQAILSARQNRDFPEPVPGWSGPIVGNAPYQITPQVRVRLSPTLLVSVSRSYYFHFGVQNWDPSFTIQVTK